MSKKSMPRSPQGKKITATVGDADHLAITRICQARGITVSQWVQEQIAEGLYRAIASGYIDKLSRIRAEVDKEEGADDDDD
ncbi:hypothetical protein IFO70_10220 [Phormidium tenue FACHB-886]|nr:hypothetical protein [Phormidium tenue FACHB-886]